MLRDGGQAVKKREALQKVYDLFKSTHWTQDSYETDGPGKIQYCSMGGLAHVLALPNDDNRVNAYAKALVAKMPDDFLRAYFEEYSEFRGHDQETFKYEPTDEFLAEVKAGKWKGEDEFRAYGRRQGEYYHAIVVSYNDAEERKLDEILELFAAARDATPEDEEALPPTPSALYAPIELNAADDPL
jgi:hypothetical protein